MPDQDVGDASDAPSGNVRGEAIDAGKGRVFPCDQCGGDLVFHIGSQKLKCPHCGFEKPVAVAANAAIAERDLRAMLERLKELLDSKQTPAEAVENKIRCDSCGATVVFLGTLTSWECPYCGSPLQREHVHSGGWRIPVDAVLPFHVDRDVAASALAAWVRSRWFAPNEFLKRGAEGKFNGVYLPFWTFDALTANQYSGQRGEHYWVTVGSGNNQQRVRQTRWSSAAGEFQRFFDDVVVNATRGMPRHLIDGLDPWPFEASKPFTQEYLAGFLARTYDVPLDEGYSEAQARMQAMIEEETRQRIGGDEQRIDDLRTSVGALTFKHVLLPTWLMAYRYNGRSFQVMVNAGTGEVQGDRPYSPIKIGLAVLLALIAAFTFVAMQH